LFAKVLDKAEAALTADPRHYRALFNAGVALLLRAAGEEGEDARALLERAEARFLAAEGQRPGSAAYNMACVEARLGDEAACLRWLEKAQRHGLLPDRKHIETDPDLEAVRGAVWFEPFLESL